MPDKAHVSLGEATEAIRRAWYTIKTYEDELALVGNSIALDLFVRPWKEKSRPWDSFSTDSAF